MGVVRGDWELIENQATAYSTIEAIAGKVELENGKMDIDIVVDSHSKLPTTAGLPWREVYEFIRKI